MAANQPSHAGRTLSAQYDGRDRGEADAQRGQRDDEGGIRQLLQRGVKEVSFPPRRIAITGTTLTTFTVMASRPGGHHRDRQPFRALRRRFAAR